MRRLLLVTALISMSAITCGIATKVANADEPGKMLQSPPGFPTPQHGHGPMPQDMAFPPPPPRDFHHGNPVMLAQMLSGMETLVGIRSNQLDAWRAYTDAVQDFLVSPMPHHEGTDADRSNPQNGSDPDDDQLSIFPERDAQMVIDHAEKARAVETAIAALRQVLTKSQLDKLSHIPFGRGPGFGPMPGAGSMHGPHPDFGGADEVKEDEQSQPTPQ